MDNKSWINSSIIQQTESFGILDLEEIEMVDRNPTGVKMRTFLRQILELYD